MAIMLILMKRIYYDFLMISEGKNYDYILQ